MSQASMSQKLDASRKATREAVQMAEDVQTGASLVPAVFWSYLAVLKMEATDPSRLSSELGVHVNGGERFVGQRSNRAAQNEIERIQAVLYRIGENGMGSYGKDGQRTGRIEQIVYGRNASNTSAEYAKRRSA